MSHPSNEDASVMNVVTAVSLQADVSAAILLVEELAHALGVTALGGLPVLERYAQLRNMHLDNYLADTEDSHPKLAAEVSKIIDPT